MTVLDRPTITPDDVLVGARDLAPTIASRAAEVEAARRMPRDLLDQLVATGCFSIVMPASHGGVGASLPDAMRLFETLAAADASVAWTVMIGAGAWVDLAGLPRPTFDALYGDPGVTITAGAFNPSGRIEPAAGAYRVDGRWSFASGCEHAQVLFGNCVEGIVDGMPQMRIAVFSPEQVVIEDTWHVLGLCGTGSHHFHVEDVVVPADHTFPPLAEEGPCVDEPIVHVPTPQLLSLAIASVALGIAAGAIVDILELAAEKVPLLAGSTLVANPRFQFELATADTDLRAARALLYETAEAAWDTALAREPFTLEQRARVRAAAVWVTRRAAAVVDAAYHLGGGSAVYAGSPLQRRLRDVHALTQHFLVKEDTLTTAGAALAGQDVHIPIF